MLLDTNKVTPVSARAAGGELTDVRLNVTIPEMGINVNVRGTKEDASDAIVRSMNDMLIMKGYDTTNCVPCNADLDVAQPLYMLSREIVGMYGTAKPEALEDMGCPYAAINLVTAVSSLGLVGKVGGDYNA